MEEGFHEGGDGNLKFNVPNLLFKVPWTTPPQNLLLSLVPDLHLLPKFLHYQRTIFNGPRIDLLKVHQVQNEALNPESMASLPFITVPVTGWNPMVCAFPRMCWVRLTGYWEPVWTYVLAQLKEDALGDTAIEKSDKKDNKQTSKGIRWQSNGSGCLAQQFTWMIILNTEMVSSPSYSLILLQKVRGNGIQIFKQNT